ncbi:monomeric sarcosine oxidase-like isoform X1 [Ptychodera flava]|uniref:monomeric sarcosine oxidase-like isoform X1 n=1 Tax=Ptychodera flava TaxID=63121 RepID=UPI00396A829F
MECRGKTFSTKCWIARKYSDVFHSSNYIPRWWRVLQRDLTNVVHIQLARANGANIEENCRVLRFEKDRDGSRILVHTSRGTFRCRRVVITAGGWTNQVLESLDVKLPITVTHEQATFVATPNLKDFSKERFPLFTYLSPKYLYYGFPIHGNTGVKLGMTASGKQILPDSLPCEPDREREQVALDFLKENIPKVCWPLW